MDELQLQHLKLDGDDAELQPVTDQGVLHCSGQVAPGPKMWLQVQDSHPGLLIRLSLIGGNHRSRAADYVPSPRERLFRKIHKTTVDFNNMKHIMKLDFDKMYA